MNSNDLTANLYFAATVRVAADRSLTRLVPLDALKEPLSPHGTFSQRILLSLQALGFIEPELSLSTAQDWLTARDWIELGLDSLAWKIRWAPRECRDRRDFANQLLRQIEPSDDALETLLAIWQDLALAETAQFAGWLLAKSGYNPQWVQTAIRSIREALTSFSVADTMYLITVSMRTMAATHQQGGVPTTRLGGILADAIASFCRRATVEQWKIRRMWRPIELPESAIATMFAHELTRLNDEYFTRPPSVAALLNAMTRAGSVH